MNVEITGRHLIVTPALRTYVMRRLRRFSKICGDDLSCHVIIDVAKGRHTAEILLRSKILTVTGKGETADMYASILRAIEKLEKQALKHKGKIIETKRQRARAGSVADKTRRGSSPAKAARRSNGIQEEHADKKPMAVEEAVLELGQSEYPFVVFRNVDSGGVNVLYRKKDGSLGLIHT
jgi:putative sigma-54 modulation protein